MFIFLPRRIAKLDVKAELKLYEAWYTSANMVNRTNCLA